MWRALKRTARFIRLPLTQQVAVIVATFVVLMARIAVRLVPYSRYRGWLRPRAIHRPLISADPRSVGLAVERAGRIIPGTRCLAQATAAQIIYRLLGYRTFAHIGAAPPVGGELRAHAWITLEDGTVVLGWLHDLDQYVPFPLDEAGGFRP